MENLSKLLNRYNKKYLYKDKSNIKTYRSYEKALSRQGLYFKVKNDQDFIKFEIIKTSYDNMRAIQKKFFEIIKEMGEIWQVISYQEKHFLLYKKLNPFIDQLKYFEVDDRRYFIAYFDYLFNAYYDHDMLMFESKAYRKYLYDFKKIVIAPDDFMYLALKSNFSQAKYILGDQDNYVLYNKSIKRFYHASDRFNSFGIFKEINEAQIFKLAKLIYNQDKLALVNYLLENDLANKALYKRLSKMQRKLLKWNFQL